MEFLKREKHTNLIVCCQRFEMTAKTARCTLNIYVYQCLNSSMSSFQMSVFTEFNTIFDLVVVLAAEHFIQFIRWTWQTRV